MGWLRGEIMLHSKNRWQRLDKQEVNGELIQSFQSELNISPLVATLLVNRGIASIDEARRFVHIKNQSFHDPFLLGDMEKVVKRVKEAIGNDEQIMIYGDYDADGVSSTTVMLTALRQLGANVDFYIPNRFSEGYGPNEEAFRFIAEQGYTLVITVDTGIAAIHEAKVAKELGMDLIITDHHEIGDELPDAYAIIHPKKEGSSYPFKELAGVGVAFKVAHALLGEVPRELLEIAAIGTIADLVPLVDENRLIAKFGIEEMKKTKRPGIKALLSVAKVKQHEINEDTIGFAIGPRINAVGRLQDADPAVDLLLSGDMAEAEMLAQEIDELNKDRQKLVQKMTEEAIQEIEANFPIEENPVLVIAKENWNSGVVGIVASKLVEKFYRPTIVLSIDPETRMAKGSARSIEGFDLFENLSKCRELLPHFGGHPMAAGMTLHLDDVDHLRNRLISYANEQLTKEDFIPIKKVDLACRLDDISVESIEDLQLLAPFGVHNPKPSFLIEEVKPVKLNQIGADKSHLKMTLEHNDYQIDAVGFGLGEFVHDISPLSKLSVVGELSINEWNNRRKPQIMLQDLAIPSWQLFDYRGKTIQQVKKDLRKHSVHFVAFQEKTMHHFDEKSVVTWIEDESSFKNLDLTEQCVVLLDMPPSIEWLDKLFEKGAPSRIYSVFSQHTDHFFATIPTREHFKWYYAFLVKRGTFDVKKYGAELAKHKGWTKETIIFMTKVFFELDFVKIDDGVISLNKQAPKRDLTQSNTYQAKQRLIELEQLLLYSSYHQLKAWFDEKFCNHVNDIEYERERVR